MSRSVTLAEYIRSNGLDKTSVGAQILDHPFADCWSVEDSGETPGYVGRDLVIRASTSMAFSRKDLASHRGDSFRFNVLLPTLVEALIKVRDFFHSMSETLDGIVNRPLPPTAAERKLKIAMAYLDGIAKNRTSWEGINAEDALRQINEIKD